MRNVIVNDSHMATETKVTRSLIKLMDPSLVALAGRWQANLIAGCGGIQLMSVDRASTAIMN